MAPDNSLTYSTQPTTWSISSGVSPRLNLWVLELKVPPSPESIAPEGPATPLSFLHLLLQIRRRNTRARAQIRRRNTRARAIVSIESLLIARPSSLLSHQTIQRLPLNKPDCFRIKLYPLNSIINNTSPKQKRKNDSQRLFYITLIPHGIRLFFESSLSRLGLGSSTSSLFCLGLGYSATNLSHIGLRSSASSLSYMGLGSFTSSLSQMGLGSSLCHAFPAWDLDLLRQALSHGTRLLRIKPIPHGIRLFFMSRLSYMGLCSSISSISHIELGSSPHQASPAWDSTLLCQASPTWIRLFCIKPLPHWIRLFSASSLSHMGLGSSPHQASPA
ncbi:hypothetical protein Fot_24349 [Forsythia ovata]|uniref:Uncharacterized protein n=1 Tax=Forsythia ovata TaxID=205694 RepID=A0ABD1U5Y5_9LAMI